LFNSKGERYMKNYYPERRELGPRDVVARATYNEIIEGRGTPHDGVWLDVTHLSKVAIRHTINKRERLAKRAGLFHFAILLPNRGYLANVFKHLTENSDKLYFEGAADHLVSESLYLRDPDKNGVEIYRDKNRPELGGLDYFALKLPFMADFDQLMRHLHSSHKKQMLYEP
jgi:hypothetical protein